MGSWRSHRAARAEENSRVLDWVHERAVDDEGFNAGRTANKARIFAR